MVFEHHIFDLQLLRLDYPDMLQILDLQFQQRSITELVMMVEHFYIYHHLLVHGVIHIQPVILLGLHWMLIREKYGFPRIILGRQVTQVQELYRQLFWQQDQLGCQYYDDINLEYGQPISDNDDNLDLRTIQMLADTSNSNHQPASKPSPPPIFQLQLS